ncbi:MAG: PAS domain-containing sensor histidine kinase [Bacteroidota bacterium]
MAKKIYKILADKFWAEASQSDQKQLFQLLTVWTIIGVVAILFFINHLLQPNADNCFICDILLVAVVVMAIVCILNSRNKCALNTIFSIPVFIYAYYISDFNAHLPPIETIHYSTWWLMAGLVILYYFLFNEVRIITYFLFSLFTIGFQLFRGNHLFDSFSYFEPFTTNPLIIFTSFFIVTYYIRKKFISIISRLSLQLKANTESINRVVQNSSFLIAQIRAERDEDGNVVNLIVERVNNAFESGFKINLYEVQEQEAEYIFNLIFKKRFNVNKILLFNRSKTTEFHATSLEKWFKIHAINPDYNKYYLIFEDITKIKKKIADLEVSKRRYKVLLEAIPDIFFVIDKDGVYEDFVIKESDLFKIEDANIIGNSIYNAGFPDNMADKVYSCIQNSLKTNSIESIEYSLNTPNGTFLFEMRLAKLNAHSVISVARDITKRKTAEFKLEKALSRAEESDRLKSAFLSNLSHEIRTPMNIITNFTRMLADAEMESMEKVELTDAISQNGKQLLNMIDNTIHLSKIETEDIAVKNTLCKVNTLVRDIYNLYSPNIPDTKDLKINLKLDVPNLDFGFKTDKLLLSEVLTILIDNAVKYTPGGEINFGYEMIRNDSIKFMVYDSGIGIAKDEFENIFSRFYRIKNSINETTSGSGIGLPIAQHYISLMGGELEFDSTVDKGSQFWFTLPFKEGQGYMRIVS